MHWTVWVIKQCNFFKASSDPKQADTCTQPWNHEEKIASFMRSVKNFRAGINNERQEIIILDFKNRTSSSIEHW